MEEFLKRCKDKKCGHLRRLRGLGYCVQINDDSEIYFYHSNDKEIQIKNQNTIFFLYKVIILFKNYYNIQEGKYTLNYQLISDFFGNIGNETGYLTVIVTK